MSVKSPGLVVRADADVRIGSGHVMRCLALCQEWQARGGSTAFLSYCPSPDLQLRIRAAVTEFVELQQPHEHSADTQEVLRLLARYSERWAQRPWLLLDGYGMTPEYQKRFRTAGYRVAVVDDMAHQDRYHADVILNQNVHAQTLRYSCDPETTLLLGSRYALIRPEFRQWPERGWPLPDVAHNVLITMGGGDPEGVTLKAIEAIAHAGQLGLRPTVVVGPNNCHTAAVKELAARSPVPITVLHNPPDMARLMFESDLAVTAAGSTCWELAHMGVPMLTAICAENQRGIADGLEQLGAGVNLGWHGDLRPHQLGRVLAELSCDLARRKTLIAVGRELVDGQGGTRVAGVMGALGGEWWEPDKLVARLATREDTLDIWRLANDPAVRRNSFHSDPIPLESHLRWFDRKLSDPDCRIWVLVLYGLLVGQIRYDRTEAGVCELGYAVVPAFRGRGLGTRILDLTWRQACTELAVTSVRGLVRKGNTASDGAFLRAGFRLSGETNRHGFPCQVFQRDV